MKPRAIYFHLGFTLLTLTCCVSNPINARTALRYQEAGAQAERAGDYALARQNYARAHTNAKLGNLGPKAEAYSLYEWSRMTGYLGNYAQAEMGFSDVLELIATANGTTDQLLGPALSEYARLLHDTGKHAEAITVFAKAIVELEKVDILSIDPLGYAAFLDDYGRSLNAANKAVHAAQIRTKASAIRRQHPEKRIQFEAKRYKVD